MRTKHPFPRDARQLSIPGGKNTFPPLFSAQASMALCSALVSSVTPSPRAPNPSR